MAYQIKRKSRLKETLELVSADGKDTLTVDIDLDVDEMGGRIMAAQDVTRMTQTLIAKEPQSVKAQEAFGSSVLALFGGIFGKENTEKIIAFYDGHYAEMLLDVIPFVNEVIVPAIQKVSAERKKQLLAAADAMRR